MNNFINCLTVGKVTLPRTRIFLVNIPSISIIISNLMNIRYLNRNDISNFSMDLGGIIPHFGWISTPSIGVTDLIL